jgi:CelD/BcsL family acetyltransferase involved in cellulose biosynthesis
VIGALAKSNTWYEKRMHLEIIQTEQALAQMVTEWNHLLANSAIDVPFLTHEFISTWWSTLGGGEWTQADLYVVAGRLADGRLVAIAPLFLSEERTGERVLRLLGTIEIADYLDLIACPAYLPEFCQALLAHLAGPLAPPWQALDLCNLMEDSATIPALRAAAEQRGWRVTQEVLQPSPYVRLPGDWETYLASLDKKQRHEIRRKMRRAETNFEPVSWYFVTDESRLAEEMEAFMDLMAKDPAKKGFLTPLMREQMQRLAQAACRAGWLQLSFMEVGGVKAAAYLNFDYGNQVWVYNSGLDFSYRELSPGWVLLGYLLQWANEQKRAAFDFLRGDEDYKYRFGGINRYVLRLKAER